MSVLKKYLYVYLPAVHHAVVEYKQYYLPGRGEKYLGT
jgi:hypothetical protein